MTGDWEYEVEAHQAYQEELSRKRYERMPELCKKCRWLDWYYMEDCKYNLYPIGGKCTLFCRDSYLRWQWLRHAFWKWQWKLWRVVVRLRDKELAKRMGI